jgi:hypothetical protein
MTAFPPIEVIRDRFPTHRSNRSSSVSKELKGFLSPSRGSAIRARHGVYFDPVKMNFANSYWMPMSGQ